MPPSANPCLMAKSIHQGFAGHNAQRVGLQVLPSLVRIGKSTWRGGIGLNAEIWERSNFRWFSAPASMCSTRNTRPISAGRRFAVKAGVVIGSHD